MSDDEILEMAVAHGLGRTLKPIGLDTGDVFYTDASYRTAELLEFARAVQARADGRHRHALETLAAQHSGRIGSTALADCMAVIARQALQGDPT